MQATQTEGSRDRGVGNYSTALTNAVFTGQFEHQFTMSANAAYELDRALLGAVRVRRYDYPPITGLWNSDARHLVAERLIEHCWRQINPDVLHVHHLFEGYGGQAIVPRSIPSAPSMVTSTTLYDLIPLRFAEHYLADDGMAPWYRSRIATLVKFDLLLAISESSRRDAIELLSINPSRVVTIMGDCDPRYRALSPPEVESRELRSRLGLCRDVVLYTGGDDYRKNLLGMLEGFAGLPLALRETHQLVIVCKLLPERKSILESDAQRLGLEPGCDVVFTGYVIDDDLVRLYNECKLFVFPSLYEGFGLPVLEAMRCGAAVIAGDNSSLPEIVQSKVALFDAAKSQALTAKLVEILTDQGALEQLRAGAAERAARFSWKESARIAVEAWEEAHAYKNSASICLSVAARSAKQRLAYFTPLTPTRSGIADFNAAFLPFLARHFEIDVYIGPRDRPPLAPPPGVSNVFSWQEYDARAGAYYCTVYEVGNSEFHAHMLPLMRRHPGVVGLHDAYLSGLVAFSAFGSGDPGLFYREMLHSHGGRARQLLLSSGAATDGVGEAMKQLPCTRRVFDDALGVISHSPFNIRIAFEQLGHLVRQPYHAIPQMMTPVLPVDQTVRQSIRAKLGIAPNVFVIATFGHIAWTKMGDVLLRAFSESGMASRPDTLLVFAGELARDPFGDELLKAVSASPVQARVRITGYLSENDYHDYLIACDVGVQLRTHSRGGTPRAVLDCLAHGIPVVVNRYASYTDYPEDVLIWVSETPDTAEIAKTLQALHGNLLRLETLARRGREYLRSQHDPATCAALYAAAIRDMVERARDASLDRAATDLGSLLKQDSERATYVTRISKALLRDAQVSPAARVLIDVSHIADSDHQTGIPRVVRSIVRELYLSPRVATEVSAVRLEAPGELAVATEWLGQQGLLVLGEQPTLHDGWCSEQDVLLMLDSSWARYEQFVPVMRRWRDRGGQVVTTVYDLIPIRHPDCVPQGGDQWFRNWLELAVAESDGIVCISRAVADDLADFVRTEKLPHPPGLRIGYWHLGGNFTVQKIPKRSQTDMRTSADPRCRFLMVGTIEPRKQHNLVIDAFERLWARGHDLELVVVGKQGWMCEDVIERMRAHPEAGRRLCYCDKADDEVLAGLYTDCDALLFASKAEGFGLPIVEAAAHGLPVLANDLPVFREIANGCALCLPMKDADQIANAVTTWLEAWRQGAIPQIKGVSMLSWRQSGEQLLGVLLDGNWFTRID